MAFRLDVFIKSFHQCLLVFYTVQPRIPAQRTMSIALLEFLSQPQNRLGTHLCAKVSIEGGWSATLSAVNDRQVVSLMCIYIIWFGFSWI